MQVLVNFVNNAIKFTRPGGRVTVLLELCDLSFINAMDGNISIVNSSITED